MTKIHELVLLGTTTKPTELMTLTGTKHQVPRSHCETAKKQVSASTTKMYVVMSNCYLTQLKVILSFKFHRKTLFKWANTSVILT